MGIKHSGGDDNEKFILKLCNVQPTTNFLVFVLNIATTGVSFKDMTYVDLRLVDSSDKRELGLFNMSNEVLTGRHTKKTKGNALIAGMLFREGETWCLKRIQEFVQM